MGGNQLIYVSRYFFSGTIEILFFPLTSQYLIYLYGSLVFDDTMTSLIESLLFVTQYIVSRSVR